MDKKDDGHMEEFLAFLKDKGLKLNEIKLRDLMNLLYEFFKEKRLSPNQQKDLTEAVMKEREDKLRHTALLAAIAAIGTGGPDNIGLEERGEIANKVKQIKNKEKNERNKRQNEWLKNG